MSGIFNTLVQRALSTSRRALRIKQTYICADLRILLPPDHLLPVYRNLYRSYDSFLPILCETFSPTEWIIDIGANCGDTVAAILSKNTVASCLCIEGDGEFFAYLKENVERLRPLRPAAKIIVVEALVGTGAISGTLQGKHGTKSMAATDRAGAPSNVDDHDAPEWLTLEQILSDLTPTEALRTDLRRSATIRLVKSDVDGYDYDVLQSAHSLLTQEDLLLFFECQYNEDSQRREYIELLARLFELKFHHFAVFDNYGNYLLETGDVAVLTQLLDYVWSQNRGRSARTIYYFDLLAWKSASSGVVSSALTRYQRFLGR